MTNKGQLYDQGVWITPWSRSPSTMAMKLISLFVLIAKITGRESLETKFPSAVCTRTCASPLPFNCNLNSFGLFLHEIST